MTRYRLVLKDSEDYDYGTGKVKGSDIFDVSTTGTTGSWQDLLKGKDLDYYKNRKNLKSKIVQMSPEEYYRECAKMFRASQGTSSTSESLKESRRIDNGENFIDNLKDVILKKKKKFPICVLDISHTPGQEGLHRMMVAGELFGWDTKFPVLLVETYDKARQERIEHDVAQREFNYFMERLVNTFKRWNFYNLDEFCELLSEKIYDEYKQSPILSEQGDDLEVQVYSDEIDDSLIYNINLKEFDIDNESDEDDEIDLMEFDEEED